MGTLATLSKYQNIVTLNCKDARELCTSLASSGHQATNSLSSAKKSSSAFSPAEPARSHLLGQRRGTTVTSNPRDGWKGAACCGEPGTDLDSPRSCSWGHDFHDHGGLQGSGSGDRRQQRCARWDGTVSISSPFTSFLPSLIQQRGGNGKGILAVSF